MVSPGTQSFHFSPQSVWIWGKSATPERNEWRMFRCPLHIEKHVVRASLLVTADTFYELYLNGSFIGRGPARGFAFAYPYDVYTVDADLIFGASNVIAVLVNALNDHTLSYIKERAGLRVELILEMNNGDIVRTGTDSTWRTAPANAFSRHTPRISVQYGFEEQFDARREDPLWRETDFDDQAWERAVVIHEPPWTGLHQRTIPLLTEDPVNPVAVKAVELAQQRLGIFWSFDVRHRANTDRTGLRTNPSGEQGWIIYSEIFAPVSCSARVHVFKFYEAVDVRINDQFLLSDATNNSHEPRTVQLRAGANLIMLRNTVWSAILIESDQHIRISAERFISNAAWVFSGVFDERTNSIQDRWHIDTLDKLPPDDPRQGIPYSDNPLDVFTRTSSQQFFGIKGGFCSYDIARATPRPLFAHERPAPVANSQALLSDNADWTTIHPQPDGDVHIVIDFDRELVGFVELDIDAPEGAIIDANFFEGIDDSGIFWMQSLRNTFRYTAREGRQVFRSHQRRGFRYGSFTLRNLNRPMKIRHIHTLLSTYPVARNGSFACSDQTLNKIWEVGAYTVQLCMLDTYIDCPGYEQVFWIGDARNSALVNAAAFGDYDITDRSIRLAGQSLSPYLSKIQPPNFERQHLTGSHAPSGWFIEIPMWSFLWIWMAWEQYWHTGDQDALADYYVDVKECLRRAEQFLTERDLFDIPDVWNLVDWAAQDLEDEGEVIANTVLFARSLNLAAKMAKVLNLPDDIEHFLKLAERLKTAINQYGWSENHKGYVDTVRDDFAYQRYLLRAGKRDSQTVTYNQFRQKQRISEPTNTLAMLCEVVPPERYDAVLKFVLASRDGNYVGSSPDMAPLGNPDQVVPVGSPWFLFFTLETLFREGFAADAVAIIQEQWNPMLEKGATTFWETFPGFVDTHWSRSLCHGWSAAPVYFLTSQVLGVTAAAPGYQRIRVAPKALGLKWASGTVPTPHGNVTVSWHIDDVGKMQVRTDAPEGCSIELVLPADEYPPV